MARQVAPASLDPNNSNEKPSAAKSASVSMSAKSGRRLYSSASPMRSKGLGFHEKAMVTPERPPAKASAVPRPVSPYEAFMSHHCLAIDCEMVGVGPGGKRSVLARASLVDFFGNCVLDTFVRVQEKVTDYRTHVSGVSATDLQSAHAIPFAECRKRVMSLIRNKILVGHGLQNDLAVLGICHPWYNIRDTCVYQPYMRLDRRGQLLPRRLRDLAHMHLGLLIQQEGIPHCSLEDAKAAMALYSKVQQEWDYAVNCSHRHAMLHEALQYCLSLPM